MKRIRLLTLTMEIQITSTSVPNQKPKLNIQSYHCEKQMDPEICEILGDKYISAYDVPLSNIELPPNDVDIQLRTEVRTSTGDKMV